MKNQISFAKNEDQKSIRLMWDQCFQEDSVAWRDWYFKYIYKSDNTIIMENDNKLLSMIHINPYPMHMNGKTIQSAALSGVATNEDDRKKGYAGALIRIGLNQMKDRGIAFSFLYPFNYDFYKKFGYEVCYEEKAYRVTCQDEPKYQLRETKDVAVCTQIYSNFCKDLNGYILRNEAYMQIKFDEHYADNNKVYLIMSKDIPIGYCMFKKNDDEIKLEELICNEPHQVAKSISSLFKLPAEYETTIKSVEKNLKVKPHCMGRIIDVISVFDGIPSKNNSVIIEVFDDIIQENNKTFIFNGESGKLQVTLSESVPDYKVDIKELSVIATGYKEGMTDNAKQIFDLLFHKTTHWIKEVC